MADVPLHQFLGSVGAVKRTGLISSAMTYIAAMGLFAATLTAISAPALGQATDAATQLTGPDAVPNQLIDDQADKPDLVGTEPVGKRWDEWKARLKERSGFDFGVDYNALGFAATESLGDDTSASGVFRIYGTWDLIGRDGPNTGSLVFKIENRHTYTDVPPSEFGPEIGYAGLNHCCFSDAGWRATHLFWQQRFADGRGVSYIGWLDITDYVDVYALASPWTGFSNLAFATGSGSMGGLPDGAFGAMVGGFLTDQVYTVGGIADANADASDLGGGLDTFFNDFETFKTLELGWTSAQEQLFLDNAHITLWQIDERDEAGTPDGWGVNFSLTKAVADHWLPFLRGGWAEDGASLYQGSLSAGFGYSSVPGRDLLGVGLNWSRPNRDTFGAKLDDQYTLEVFQQWQVTERVQITPSVQLIKDPALNPSEDFTAVFGLRGRIAF